LNQGEFLLGLPSITDKTGTNPLNILVSPMMMPAELSVVRGEDLGFYRELDKTGRVP